MLPHTRLPHGPVIGAAILAAMLSAIPSAQSAPPARMSFDGSWSVLIITDSGSCDRAYRYGVRISDGRVYYEGRTGVDISGRVSRNGRVEVQVRQGDQQAVGTGRLSGDSGGGQWQGTSPDQQCAGHWIAERRDGQ
jgi:hypothetical protein